MKPYMSPQHVEKRNGLIEQFDIEKVIKAVRKAMEAKAVEKPKKSATKVAKKVEKSLNKKLKKNPDFVWNVEDIQDQVELELMRNGFLEVAKWYILYREKRNQERKRDVFRKRVHIKPYEYPELLWYVDAIRHSYWIHTEFNFTSDVQDYNINIQDHERNAIKNSMLAIAQIEIAVKTFWGDIYKKMPKAEIGSVGATFAESEVRHQDAYSHLLEILWLNEEFKKIKDIPVIIKRVNYLEKAIRNAKSENDEEYAQSLLLFSLFIEHVSLFSQFLIIMAFNKHKNIFKGISNVVEATSKEEQIHGLFGIDLINIIKEENPSWFDDAFADKVKKACHEAYEAEKGIIEWIFEQGEIDFLPIKTVDEFVKNRFNNSLVSIGVDKIFEVDDEILEETERFDDEIIATKHGDFFVKRSTNYNKKSKSITSDDLF